MLDRRKLLIVRSKKPLTRLQQLVQSLATIIVLSLLLTETSAQNALQPIGHWREHLPYYNTIQVVATPEKVFAATTNNVFSVDNNELQRYSKVTGLNDIGVNAIAWDETTQQLVIAYNNSNIDIIKNRTVRNIGDIRRSTISGNKTIYYIYCLNGKAYLCSGLGIIIIDLNKYEVSDTWRIGTNGSQIRVNSFSYDGNYFYAATEEGLKRAPAQSPNLSDFRNWNTVSGSNLPVGNVDFVMPLANQTVVEKNDTIYISNGIQWAFLYADTAWPIVSINTAANKILVCQRTSSGNSRVLIMNNTGIIERTLTQPGVISFPRWATIRDNAVWVADFFGGLSRFTTSVDRFIPDGPLGTATGEMVVHKGVLYAAAGSVNEAWNYQYNRNGIYIFNQGTWTNINSFNTPALDSVLDIITLAIDPTDESLWAGSYGGGLIKRNLNGQIQVFKRNNSTLQPAVGDPNSTRVSGLAFDHNQHLWISNYGAPQNLQVKKPDGTFKAFTIPFFHTENAVSQIAIDDANQVWIVSPKGNGVFVYNPGNSIDQTNDDKWKYLKAGRGSGNLPSNIVYCVTKDKFGFMWIGTSNGIGIVQCPEQIFDPQGCEAIQPVVQQDRFAGLLFQNEEVRTIAVDGANRKWVGTRNGVWLISPEGDKIIYRFTEDNSPLLSNEVYNIAIDQLTGEVFIATFKGICSFRSTATEASYNDQKVVVFPNPVPPGYNGTIAIRGVANNAVVKITELNGRMVYQTRALGSQAVWNGRNYKGEKVASGVYLVVVRDEMGQEKQVSKIVLTSGK